LLCLLNMFVIFRNTNCIITCHKSYYVILVECKKWSNSRKHRSEMTGHIKHLLFFTRPFVFLILFLMGIKYDYIPRHSVYCTHFLSYIVIRVLTEIRIRNNVKALKTIHTVKQKQIWINAIVLSINITLELNNFIKTF